MSKLYEKYLKKKSKNTNFNDKIDNYKDIRSL